MAIRKINLWLLLKSGILYRLLIVSVDIIFFKLYVELFIKVWGTTVTAIIVTLLNMILYYAYHFLFASLFKLGDNQ